MRQCHTRLLLAAMLLLSLLLTACGGPAASSVGGTPSPVLAASVAHAAAVTPPARPELILATTTSTQDSGLLDVLIPDFEARTGYQVKPVAVGSGAALKMGEDGNADVLLVHSPAAEEAFMAKDAGVDRRLIMHNDFIIVGPPGDPAHIKGQAALPAMKAIAATGAPFVSRGDASGTNALELSLWKQAGIDPKGKPWYIVSGQGMGATLNVTDEKNAYTISDRATYLAFKARLQLQILAEKDRVLLNIYHVIRVNPAKQPSVNTAGAQAFADYLISPEGQALIANFGTQKYGQALFVPDAGKDEASLGQ
ncbi:MAG TPA: substrate-binding domain-containing protein [Chloroflexia bacterium]